MLDILSIEMIYGIGSVLLTMAVLAPVVFAGSLGRPGAESSFLGERLRIGGAWRLLEAVSPGNAGAVISAMYARTTGHGLCDAAPRAKRSGGAAAKGPFPDN